MPVVAAVASFAVLYADAFRSLVRDWLHDDNYSHGLLIVPIALYLVWERRDALARATRRPSRWGLALVAASLLATVAGTLGAEMFLARAPLIGVLAGGVLYVLGWHHLRLLQFPLALLVLMVPLPSLIFNQLAFPLQLLASAAGESGLHVLDIPVLREGNIIMLAGTTLEVAEACSGIRSLVSLLTLGLVYAYYMDSRAWVRATLVVSTVPIAVVANAVRVAGTGIAAHFYGSDAAEGFLHTFSGWIVFGVALGAMFLLQGLIAWLRPEPLPTTLAEA